MGCVGTPEYMSREVIEDGIYGVSGTAVCACIYDNVCMNYSIVLVHERTYTRLWLLRIAVNIYSCTVAA
jgi:hypothetical protein